MTKKKFDKYALYIEAVQSPELDVPFFARVYKELKKKKALSLREDFCGTYILCQEWVKHHPQAKAYGVDLDPEPIAYGDQLMQTNLSSEQQKRVNVQRMNVLDPKTPSADIVASLNFSHFIFKERKQMKDYFVNVFKTLPRDGVFIVDCFGGSQCFEPIEEKTPHKSFTYYWDQVGFDPITNFAHFYIHFKPKGGKKVNKVFSYDWRMWSIPELREILHEAGFKKTTIYWEGTTKKGEGDGNFQQVTQGEDCQSWIAYIAAEK